jgi:hypothetical protein
VARNFVRNVRNPPPGGEWRLIRTHVDAYLLSLLTSEILQGLGAIMDVKWVHDGVVYCSDYCTAQGAIQMIGETGVAMGTLVSYGDKLSVIIYTSLVIIIRSTDPCGLPGNHSPHLFCHLLSLDTRPALSLDLSYRHSFYMDLRYTFRRYCLLCAPL